MLSQAPSYQRAGGTHDDVEAAMTLALVPSVSGSGREMLDCSELDTVERFDAWTDAVSRSFVPLTADLPDGFTPAGFDGALVSQQLGSAEISTVTGSAVSVRRTQRQIARADPGFIKLGLQLRGYSVITQDGRDAALAPGDFAIYDTRRPYQLDFDDSFRMFVVMFPLKSLSLNHRQLSSLTASRFSGRRGLGAITSSFLGEMSRQLDSDSLGRGFQVSDAIFELVAATLGERLDEATSGDENAQRRLLLARIDQHIVSHLGDSRLSVTGIAAAHHISVRYLQKLFEEQEETVRGRIRHRRLEEARRDLLNPSLAQRPIAAIGASWGFDDAASFARAFRKEFGVSPRECRVTAHN